MLLQLWKKHIQNQSNLISSMTFPSPLHWNLAPILWYKTIFIACSTYMSPSPPCCYDSLLRRPKLKSAQLWKHVQWTHRPIQNYFGPIFGYFGHNWQAPALHWLILVIFSKFIGNTLGRLRDLGAAAEQSLSHRLQAKKIHLPKNYPYIEICNYKTPTVTVSRLLLF